jgi:hypothetical protein
MAPCAGTRARRRSAGAELHDSDPVVGGRTPDHAERVLAGAGLLLGVEPQVVELHEGAGL